MGSAVRRRDLDDARMPMVQMAEALAARGEISRNEKGGDGLIR